MQRLLKLVVGKPSRTMFEMAVAWFGSKAANTVMIGDNPETAGVGACGAGITSILAAPANTMPALPPCFDAPPGKRAGATNAWEGRYNRVARKLLTALCCGFLVEVG